MTPRAPARRLTRLVRVAVLGGSSLLLAGAAHLAGGGVLPSPGVLVVAALLLGLVAVTVTARRCHFPALLVLLTVEQLLMHLVFAAAGGAATCSALVTAGHHHAIPVAGPGCPPMSDTMGMPGWGMWAAHAAALLATAWLLARGESWLWRTTERIVRVATAAPTAPIPVAHPATASASPDPVDNRIALTEAAPRGPPVLSRR